MYFFFKLWAHILGNPSTTPNNNCFLPLKIFDCYLPTSLYRIYSNYFIPKTREPFLRCLFLQTYPPSTSYIKIIWTHSFITNFRYKSQIPHHKFGFLSQHSTVQNLHRLLDYISRDQEDKKSISWFVLNVSLFKFGKKT